MLCCPKLLYSSIAFKTAGVLAPLRISIAVTAVNLDLSDLAVKRDKPFVTSSNFDCFVDIACEDLEYHSGSYIFVEIFFILMTSDP